MTTITKNSVIDALHEKTKFQIKDIREIMEALDELIVSALKADQKVTIGTIGQIVPAHRKSRESRNPRTGESITTEAFTTAKLKPSKTIRAALS